MIMILSSGYSFLSHSSDINDFLEGLDGVLEDWLDRLHDTESSLHIVNLWLHAFNGLHFSGNFNEWLSIIESLEDSSGKRFLDVFDSGGLGNGGITISSGLGFLSRAEVGCKLGQKLVLVHVFERDSLGSGDESNGEFHFKIIFLIIIFIIFE